MDGTHCTVDQILHTGRTREIDTGVSDPDAR